MTALLLTEVFPPRTGGSGRWFWEVYRRLPRTAIAAGECPGHEAFDRSHDLRLTRLPLALPSWGVCTPASLYRHGGLVRSVRRLVRQSGAAEIHCGKCLPEGTIALALKYATGTPYFAYVHGEEMTLAAGSRELRWLTRRVLGGARLLVANSRNTARMLRDEWDVPPARVRVLHPGVDTGRFVPAARDPAARDRLGWGDRPVVLTVGRLQKRKGHDVLIAVMTAVRRTVPDVLYAVVGDGEERPALEALVAREGLGRHVQFLGEVADDVMVQCYQQCDLFVLPNRQVGQDIEGFGMVLLEAQACGKPVVAGTSGGTAETMRIPDTGLIVPCERPDPLAAVLAELLPDPGRLARMGAAGRRWVVEQFDWAAVSRRTPRLRPAGRETARPCACGTA
jgi:phosphatidylinositol alpha-1,6-mannosyltransferase